ncbi:hypothetical protein VT84_37490 [Gemmata sp. SH-PL17]|uniref:hypothetical protein n=1 Tax=Gemmata sp. SH-PL17 TaxID=1630693 RepID=UPI00078B55FD|nr:hypothetical protein [Gemmata sp. SH-PL17]AMV30147.1 hypothetical protein VT84_37490 [Gemmata sp. SH-PL17]
MSTKKVVAGVAPEVANKDRTLVGVKLPRWLKQFAAQIAQMTGEDIGDVFERHAGDSITEELRLRSEALIDGLKKGA